MMPSLRLFVLGLWATALVTGSLRLAGAETDIGGIEFFERKVRPVLADHCYGCHGEEKQKGHLRLDSPGAILAGGETGDIVVPGQPDASRLIRAVSYQDENLKMPPKTRLSDRQIADLTEWVKRGAPLPQGADTASTAPVRREFQITAQDRAHWAFQPVRRPPLPKVNNDAKVSNPIDAFVLARLDEKGLQPNPPATRRELIRRAHYDLTGLPPRPEEIHAFVNDPSPGAWEALVDRLLESPHYGEKWGRHWLDLVRFAETNSYERDADKPHAWRFRDYVIRSFNADKPYDRFIREQLAGDELPSPDPDSIIATGFYRLGIWDDEPADRELARYDSLDDIVTVTGQVFLGLTIDCARCHNHKIDPIPQKDYYRLLSFFQNINHYRNGGPTDEVSLFHLPAEKAAYEEKVRELEQKRNDLQATVATAENLFRERYVQGLSAGPADLDDLRFRFYRDTWEKLPNFDELKPEDAGAVPAGLFDLSLRSRDTAFGFVFEGFLIVPREGDHTFFLDSDDGARLIVDNMEVIRHDGTHPLGQEQRAAIRLKAGRLPVRLEYFQRDGGFGLQVAWAGPDFSRRSLSTEGNVAPEKVELARKDLNKLMQQEGARVLGREQFAAYQETRKELEKLKRESIPVEKALAVTETGARARETFVLLRGNPEAKGPEVTPGFLEVLGSPDPVLPSPAPDARTSGRRTVLANWITSPDNPLTARVMVNRIWQYHFGQGLVRSPNNFGLQGDAPTHPELLDWLADEFVARGWSLKAMHRLIMTSDVYRMSSRGRPEALALDPQNQWLWRFDMRRLTAEEIRDSILAINGTLNPEMYGPSVYVDIPKEVMAGQSVPGKGWGKSPPADQARRSVYIFVKRSLLTPILESFDVAETDRPTPARFATIQPTQALGMLNGEFLNRQAEVFAERLRREGGGSLDGQVRLALALATARPPSDSEVRRGVDLVKALQNGDGPGSGDALKYFCLMTLNLNEMIYLD